MSLNEDAALEWFRELGYAVGTGRNSRRVNRRRRGVHADP